MAESKSLQKLTETDRKINRILERKIITIQDVRKVLNPVERKHLKTIIFQRLNELKGIDRQNFIDKVSRIQGKDFKNQMWERNHYMIVAAINNYIHETGMMPTKNNIHADTNISRQTINKHLKEYYTTDQYKERQNSFKIMSDKVLTKLISMALSIQGDVKAARLYFEVTGVLGGMQNNSNIDTQNNYIQINQIKLSQDIINELPPDQRAKIEEILKPTIQIPKHNIK
jgi:hypothetical protein